MEIADRRYIVYKEYNEKFPQKFTVNTLKLVGDNTAILIKNNSKQTRMIFEKGRRHHCPYYTEFGTLIFGVFTSDICFSADEFGGKLELRYTLDVNSSLISKNELNLNFKKIGNEEK